MDDKTLCKIKAFIGSEITTVAGVFAITEDIFKALVLAITAGLGKMIGEYLYKKIKRIIWDLKKKENSEKKLRN